MKFWDYNLPVDITSDWLCLIPYTKDLSVDAM
jgi:hypothetical protein